MLDRLKASKVYSPDRADRALERFFTHKNLTRLREITLTEARTWSTAQDGGPRPTSLL